MMTDFTVPKEVTDALAALDAAGKPLDEFSVQSELNTIANKLGALPAPEMRGLDAEYLAFTFVGQNEQTSLWGTHYGPMMTRQDKAGNTICGPDISAVDPALIAYWTERAAAVSHPVLKARYADLAWDFAPSVGAKRNVDTVKTAINAYIAASAAQHRDGLHARLRYAVRSFDLAMQIKDQALSDAARANLLVLHDEAIAQNQPVWWIAPTRLFRDNRTGMSAAQRNALVQGLETLVVEFGDISKPNRFDPHDLERVADLLKKHYKRHGTKSDFQRLDEAVARGFEAAAGLGDVMVAPSFLQSAINAYSDAGMKEDAARNRKAMEEAIKTSNAAMATVGVPVEIKREDVDKFVASVVQGNAGTTFALLAETFLIRKALIEKLVQEGAEIAPLQAMIPKQIMAADHVAGKVGSVEDDANGPLIHRAEFYLAFDSVWLMQSLEAAIETHELTADHFAVWSARHGLFDDITFLKEGFGAFLDEDYAKALHILVPQVEAGLRAIAVKTCGEPGTKPRRGAPGVSVSINMGDILSNQKVLDVIGPDIALHFQTLYSDARGINLRNLVAHGLFRPADLNPHIIRLVVHSLLVLGVWKDIVAARTKLKAS
jgi:lysyl-tRNA synthetase class 1